MKDLPANCENSKNGELNEKQKIKIKNPAG